MFARRKLLCTAAASLLSLSATPLVHAQAYPSRPITLNVGFAAGGSTDIAARLIAQKLSVKLGQPVIVQSRPGAAGMLAAEQVAKAQPDGYQLLILAIGTLTNATLSNRPNFNLERDLTPISMSGFVPLVLLASPNLPVRNVNELIALAKSQPGKLTFGSDGIGAASHLAGELFNKLAKIDTLHVPYKGGAESVVATSSGQVDMNLPTVTSALSMIQGGKVKPLAVSGPTRSPLLPDVPTFDELGIKGFDLVAFISVMGPPGMPKPIVDRLNAAIVEVSKDPEFRASAAKQGMESSANTPEQLTDYLHKLKETVARLGRESNIKLD